MTEFTTYEQVGDVAQAGSGAYPQTAVAAIDMNARIVRRIQCVMVSSPASRSAQP